MPRLTKETNELNEKNKLKTEKTSNKTTTKKTTKKADAEVGATKKSAKKADAEVGATKKTTKKADTEVGATQKTVAKKADTKTSSIKKATSKSVKTEVIEYYDLPYRYDKTIVKILAQTPKKLFVYWDISDTDRKNFIKTYGENFFNITKPVLLIKNTTMNYSFEVDINDFANCWYLNINDSDCKYSIELGRRPIEFNSNINADYIHISSSNDIEAPNDHILFENEQNMVYFRNVKTNMMTAKRFTSLSFLTNMGRIYNIYDLYKKIYNDEELDEINNPSSSFMK